MQLSRRCSRLSTLDASPRLVVAVVQLAPFRELLEINAGWLEEGDTQSSQRPMV